MTGDDPGGDGPKWTLLDIEELEAVYWDHVAPALRADGRDPESERPSHQWLRENGFRTLIYTLREHHDRTFSEFWAEDLGLAASADDGYEWASDDEATVDALESFLEKHAERNEPIQSARTVRTYRYRLNRYVRAYTDANGHGDLLSPVARESNHPDTAAIDQCLDAFDRLNVDLDGARTKRRILEITKEFYASLLRRRRARLNPAEVADGAFSWNVDDGDPVHLEPDHVRALYRAAETPEERLLVVALCGWGLRSGEVAALHASQFVLDPDEDDVPYVAFDERKNGPGTVSLLYGVADLEDRLDEFGGAAEWNGYLFPSSESETGHIARQTLLSRFDELAERAALPAEIGGEKPVPQMGRRFWYTAYSNARDAAIQDLEDVAAEQGSSSPEVVWRKYLDEEQRRKMRREQMRDVLAGAFS
ncbi:hypothetical protein [Halospeciosus flavus]|uniref:Tyr recombinase domain-containing protein n=2 Tax=Halospeciosus flavus TaxID=3032283 RepID=A0ABD5Z0S2_9EURY|nr:hypothetical protein [Halospeciosus flavus]